MHTADASIEADTATTARKRSALRAVTVCALAASVVNVVLWGIGRAAGASFLVDPAVGSPNVQVSALKVVVTTVLPFAVGVLLLALARRRSHRWVVGVGVVGAAFALSSAAGPLDGGHDTATGVLLATMHLTTGGAFVVASARFMTLHEAKDAHLSDPLENRHRNEAGSSSDGAELDQPDAG